MKSTLSVFVILCCAALSTAQVNLVADFNPGLSNFSPSNFIVYNNHLYFSADDSSGTNTGGVDVGREPWKSDGTAAGTMLLKDIRMGNANGVPSNFFVYNNLLYFTAFDNASELWSTDGTTAGTVLVDLIPTEIGESPNRATLFNNSVFFTARVNGNVNQLVEWDGISPGVVAADAGNPSAITNVLGLTEFNNQLFLYMSYSPDDATTGNELYSYDPATDLYQLIADINTGSGNSSISNFAPTTNTLYFEALGLLYQTDGTTVGTFEVAAANTLGITGVTNLYVFGDLLLFEGDTGAGDQLFSLNTMTGVITQLSFNTGTNINHDPSDFQAFNGLVYYRGEDSNDTDANLWSTDGVSITQIDNSVKDVDQITLYNNKLYFEGEIDGVTGNELFVYDPATASIEVSGLGSIQLYPNPTKNKIFLSGDLSQASSYIINDLSGRKIAESALFFSEIELNLDPGLYILQILSSSNKISRKFVVE